MKKVIRLTEGDLINLVKRVIKEQSENISKQDIKDLFKEKEINTIGDANKKLKSVYGSEYSLEIEPNSSKGRRGVHLYKNELGEKKKILYTWPIKIGHSKN